YPATVAVFYLCGTGPGLLMTLLGALAGYYLFIPPYWTFAHEPRGYFMVGVYLVGALLTGLVVYQLQRYANSLQRTVAKLQDSENLFRSFMDNSSFMSWMKDKNGKYIFLNKHYEERFEISGQWLGKTDFDLFPASNAELFRENDLKVLRSGLPIVVEEITTGLNGAFHHLLSTKFPYVDVAGNQYVGGIAVDITDRKMAEEKIENLAFYDPLTGLPNRRLLQDRLAHVLNTSTRHRQLGALLFIDLDNFKTLNDTHGHDQGDQLLQLVAQRLLANMRKGDTLARLGGDEFVILLENLSQDPLVAATQAETVGEKILDTLGQPYALGALSHRSTPSIGITLFGDIPEPIEEPLRRADLAMYQAKAAGRNTLRFFDPEIQAAMTARSLLETDLRIALTHNQLLLHYQPQVIGDNRLTGAEALVRWLHPTRGMVSPAEFIPLAEDTGLIIPLGRWVLDTACAQLARWANQPSKAHLTIAVNVSPRQFHQPDFVEQVLAALAVSAANPQRLKLELTEGLLVANVEDVITKMVTLKNKGISFSLDDFGTGYSSLAYLKRLPLDQLKIDQSFVKDILIDANDAAIAKTIIALASSLGLSVIAEGVEQEAQRQFLAEHGCDAYQGYLFSRPVPIESFDVFTAPV
ncbi:MAG: EAL domain-containing protein, partial [Spongiibacteraceae bacterium]